MINAIPYTRSTNLASKIVRVKYRRYLKMVMGSWSFRNSSSLYLKSARANLKII